MEEENKALENQNLAQVAMILGRKGSIDTIKAIERFSEDKDYRIKAYSLILGDEGEEKTEDRLNRWLQVARDLDFNPCVAIAASKIVYEAIDRELLLQALIGELLGRDTYIDFEKARLVKRNKD